MAHRGNDESGAEDPDYDKKEFPLDGMSDYEFVMNEYEQPAVVSELDAKQLEDPPSEDEDVEPREMHAWSWMTPQELGKKMYDDCKGYPHTGTWERDYLPLLTQSANVHRGLYCMCVLHTLFGPLQRRRFSHWHSTNDTDAAPDGCLYLTEPELTMLRTLWQITGPRVEEMRAHNMHPFVFHVIATYFVMNMHRHLSSTKRDEWLRKIRRRNDTPPVPLEDITSHAPTNLWHERISDHKAWLAAQTLLPTITVPRYDIPYDTFWTIRKSKYPSSFTFTDVKKCILLATADRDIRLKEAIDEPRQPKPTYDELVCIMLQGRIVDVYQANFVAQKLREMYQPLVGPTLSNCSIITKIRDKLIDMVTKDPKTPVLLSAVEVTNMAETLVPQAVLTVHWFAAYAWATETYGQFSTPGLFYSTEDHGLFKRNANIKSLNQPLSSIERQLYLTSLGDVPLQPHHLVVDAIRQVYVDEYETKETTKSSIHSGLVAIKTSLIQAKLVAYFKEKKAEMPKILTVPYGKMCLFLRQNIRWVAQQALFRYCGVQELEKYVPMLPDLWMPGLVSGAQRLAAN